MGAFGHVFGLSGRFAREWCHFMHYQSQNAMVLCTFQRKSGFRCGVAKVLFQNVAKHIVFSHYLGFGGDLGVIWGQKRGPMDTKLAFRSRVLRAIIVFYRKTRAVRSPVSLKMRFARVLVPNSGPICQEVDQKLSQNTCFCRYRMSHYFDLLGYSWLLAAKSPKLGLHLQRLAGQLVPCSFPSPGLVWWLSPAPSSP